MSQAYLDESQNVAFDVDQISDPYWKLLDEKVFSSCAPTRIGEFGGGSGRLADRLIDRFPEAIVDVIDISDYLLERNRKHPQKTIIKASITEYLSPQKYDLIFINYVLHHLVGKNASDTQKLIVEALTNARRNLTPQGKLVVFEISPEGYLTDEFSTRLLFFGTSSRALEPITRALGANTAGVGVYYMGGREIAHLAAKASLDTSVVFEGGLHTERTRLFGLIRRLPDVCYVMTVK